MVRFQFSCIGKLSVPYGRADRRAVARLPSSLAGGMIWGSCPEPCCAGWRGERGKQDGLGEKRKALPLMP